MTSAMLKACQIVGVMLAMCIITVSAVECANNGDCTNEQICWKMSDCTKGTCTCAPNWRVNDAGNCQEASTLLGEGDTCIANSKGSVCDSYSDIGCAACPESPTDYKCRSGAISLRVSIIAVIGPIIMACFF